MAEWELLCFLSRVMVVGGENQEHVEHHNITPPPEACELYRCILNLYYIAYHFRNILLILLVNSQGKQQ